MNRFANKTARSAIQGSLIGGAVGDALGYAVEFMRWGSIQEEYGPAGIQRYELTDGVAEISDDTQMTLATANGLLTGYTRKALTGKMDAPQAYIYAAYRDWYYCQTHSGRRGEPLPVSPKNSTWVSHLPEMHALRAPGNTCLAALGSGAPGSTEEPLNHSKGCGGVMRVAPVALWYKESGDITHVDRLAAEAAALTHGHPLAWLPAAALAHMVSRAAFGGCATPNGLDSVYADCREALPRVFPDNGFVRPYLEVLDRAAALAHNDEADESNIRALGEGWTGDEALAIALYCALRYQDDFTRAMIASVNHSGDSDSTGAVAGNLLGAWLGLEGIEPRWRQNLELYDEIMELGTDLSRDCALEGIGNDAAWRSKYCEGRPVG